MTNKVDGKMVRNYFKNLVNRFFKILPMFENKDESLVVYMERAWWCDMGNAWGNYRSRTVVRGDTRRETALERERRYLKSKVPNSLDYNIAIVDGVEQRLAIIDSDNYDQKTICSMPGEDIRCGARVDWAGQHWLVITKDAKTELRTRCIMLQCNYLLRFVGYDGSIQERWCYIEDGTKLIDSFRVAKAA